MRNVPIAWSTLSTHVLPACVAKDAEGTMNCPHTPYCLGHANCPPPWHTFARLYNQKEQCKKLPFFERVFSRPMKLGVQNTLSTLLLHDD